MKVHFRCIQCGRRYAAESEHAGKVTNCPKCGQPMFIPEAGEGLRDTYDLAGSTDEPEVALAPAIEGKEPGQEQFVTADTMPKRGGKPRPVKVVKRSRWEANSRQVILLSGIAFVLAGGGWLAYQWWPRTRIWVPASTDGRQVAVALPRFSNPGPGVEIATDVLFQEIRLPGAGQGGATPEHAGRLWLYQPRGEFPAGSLPMVLVGVTGAKGALSEDEQAHHLPFIKAGFVVLAYEIEGVPKVRGGPPGDAARRFLLDDHAGLVPAGIALEYALQRLPQIDARRIYALGHGWAGTAALRLAANDGRIRGCAAIAAPSDLEQWFGPGAAEALAKSGDGEALQVESPRTYEAKIACPVLLVHAQDDITVPVEQSQELAQRLEALGKPVTLEILPNGGHDASLLRQAIPRVVTWLEGLPG